MRDGYGKIIDAENRISSHLAANPLTIQHAVTVRDFLGRLAFVRTRKGKPLVAKRHTSSSRGLVARVVAVACASAVVVSCVGFGIASAVGGSSEQVTFATSPAQTQVQSLAINDSSDGVTEGLVLETAAKRDVTSGVEEIAAEEEAARIAAEEQARAEEQACIDAANAAKAAAAVVEASILEDVDFTCGKEAFMAEWTARIDAYLEGSPLAGYGATFAEAAWNNGVDPRWSPAISNTESTKGANCFRSHNAWGWMGDASWSSWEEAINAHVAGLAEGYGYTISVANAKKYCPPTYLDWYEKTLSEMAKI